MDKTKEKIVFDWLKSQSAPSCFKNSINQITLENISGKLLQFYQGQCSLEFNRHWRNKYKSSTIDDIRLDDCISLICIELKTFPQYSGKLIYRHELTHKSFGEVSNWFLKNKEKVISFPSFLSCSKNKESWNGEIIITIETSKTSNAYDINGLNPTNTEREVLFMPGTNFKIVEIDESKRLILLHETADSHDIVLYENEGFYNIRGDESNSEHSLSDLVDDF